MKRSDFDKHYINKYIVFAKRNIEQQKYDHNNSLRCWASMTGPSWCRHTKCPFFGKGEYSNCGQHSDLLQASKDFLALFNEYNPERHIKINNITFYENDFKQ